MTDNTKKTGLILTGGGARAAYQVGVLQAVSELLGTTSPNPFPIVCGTSAGAVNAAALAIRANDFAGGVRHLREIWDNIHARQVYRTDLPATLKTGARWLGTVSLLYRNNPVSLLDNSPLRAMLGAADAAGADWVLDYAGRSRSTMAFAAELVAAHPDRVRLHVADEGGRFDVVAVVWPDGREPQVRHTPHAFEATF